MVNKTSLVFLPSLLLLLAFISASSDAVPTSRSRMMFKDDQQEVALHDSHAQDVIENGGEDSELFQVEGFVERRMEIETTDYPRTGANNHHDPRTPGSV